MRSSLRQNSGGLNALSNIIRFPGRTFNPFLSLQPALVSNANSRGSFVAAGLSEDASTEKLQGMTVELSLGLSGQPAAGETASRLVA